MKETQGQSWVIAAVRALRPRIRFLLFSFSLSTTPLPPSLPLSLFLFLHLPLRIRAVHVSLLCRGTYGTTRSLYLELYLSPHTGCSTSISKFPEVEETSWKKRYGIPRYAKFIEQTQKGRNSYLFARAIYTRKMTKTRAKIAQNRTTLEQYSLSLYSPRDRNVRDKK